MDKRKEAGQEGHCDKTKQKIRNIKSGLACRMLPLVVKNIYMIYAGIKTMEERDISQPMP